MRSANRWKAGWSGQTAILLGSSCQKLIDEQLLTRTPPGASDPSVGPPQRRPPAPEWARPGHRRSAVTARRWRGCAQQFASTADPAPMDNLRCRGRHVRRTAPKVAGSVNIRQGVRRREQSTTIQSIVGLRKLADGVQPAPPGSRAARRVLRAQCCSTQAGNRSPGSRPR